MVAPDRERINRLLIAGGVGLMIIAILHWWFTNFMLVEKERRVDISEEVFLNPYLAANQFLESFDKEVRTFSSVMNINDLSAEVDTLILVDLYSDIPVTQYEILMDWVQSGGHLIVEAEFPWGEFDDQQKMRLMDDLDLDLVDLSELSADEPDEEDEVYSQDLDSLDSTVEVTDDNQTGKGASCSQGDNYWYGSSHWNLVQVTLGDSKSGQNTAEVVFPSDYVLVPEGQEPDPDLSVYVGEEGYHLVQRDLGDGRVSMITDSDFWANPHVSADVIDLVEDPLPATMAESFDLGDVSIDTHDHAYLLALLVGEGKRIWWLYDTDFPSLVQILWKHFPQTMSALLILIFAWLWWLNNAFGPLRREDKNSRRSQMEHLHMSARYEWNLDRAELRVRSSRKHLMREIKRKHPRLGNLSDTMLFDELAEMTGLSASQVAAALHGGWENETRFIEVTSYIQTIRRKI